MKLPRYVTLDGTALRLKGEDWFGGRQNCMYYKDAGHWSVEFEERDGKLFSKSSMKHLNNVELIQSDWVTYRKANKGYL